jgi:hypothetical protein
MRVLVQAWTETERGWGQRPDGFSIHFDSDQHVNYLVKFQNWQQEKYGGVVPDEYDYPDGDPFYAEIVNEFADEDITKSVLVGESFRTFDRSPKWLRKV